jgi:subtilisin family serine protease
VIVTLREQADIRALPQRSRRARQQAVIDSLHATADQTQVGIKAFLERRRAVGKVTRVTPFWIFNGLAVTATPAVIDELAARPDVVSVTPDATIPAPSFAPAATTPEWGVDRVNAPALWDLGYRGQGVVVASMDTGVDLNHPDLLSRWRGGTDSWYDPYGQHPTTPTDVTGHGTATMGVTVGGDAGGTSIGVAPDAEWIAVKIFNDQGNATASAIHLGYQWLLDPDNDPTTPDAPDVVNNSWDFTNPGCDLTFEQDLANLRGAGILPVFAAGNSGPLASTSVSPANNPDAFAVGATDSSDLVFSSSSRGPSACGEPQSVFPELVAPGVSIRSSDLFGGYAVSSGTSLAAPHVTGVLALLLSAFPDATPERQVDALEGGAVDLGPAGADDTYGYGRLDALAAYNWLGSHPDFTVSASPASASTSPGGSVAYTISLTPANGFADDVALSLEGLSPTQSAWAFTPAVVAGGSGSSELSVTAAESLPPGTYPLTIRATGGGLTRTSRTALVVEPPPDFTISASPPSATTVPGGSVAYTVSVSPANGFAADVTLSLSGLSSSQASWTFTPASVTGGSGTTQLTVTTTTTLPPGSYPLTITGTGGGLTRTTQVTLVVSSGPYSISISPTARSVRPGGSTTYRITVTAVPGFRGTIRLAVTGLPAGTRASFDPSSAIKAPRSATMTVKTGGRTSPGTYTLTVHGSVVRVKPASAPVAPVEVEATLTVT